MIFRSLLMVEGAHYFSSLKYFSKDGTGPLEVSEISFKLTSEFRKSIFQ